MDEYNRTGKLTNFFKSVLEYYRELPPIEQAQYPTNYASDLDPAMPLLRRRGSAFHVQRRPAPD